MTRPLPEPTFGHAAEAFVVAHEAPRRVGEGHRGEVPADPLRPRGPPRR
jgi:hypothetical protein